MLPFEYPGTESFVNVCCVARLYVPIAIEQERDIPFLGEMECLTKHAEKQRKQKVFVPLCAFASLWLKIAAQPTNW